MHPLKQLQQLLAATQPTDGTVIAREGMTVRVATTQGPLTLTVAGTDATAYRPGDRVRLVNGQVVGRRCNRTTVVIV